MKGRYRLCTVERTKVIRSYALNLASGEKTFRAETTANETCGTPLFGDVETVRGVCNSCLDGYTYAENFPTERGLKQIEGAK